MKEGRIKRWMENIRKSGYKLRIVGCLFGVAVLSIGIVDAIVFREVSFWVEEDSKNEEKSVLENLTSIYENYVVSYQEQAQLLSLNQNIRAYLLSGGKEESHIDSIYQSMKALATNRPEISSVILFYKDEVLASYDIRNVSMDAKEEVIEKITESKTDKEIFYVYANNRAYKKQMIVFRSDREYLYGPSVWGVALLINLNDIQEYVLPENNGEDALLYILHESGELVAMQKKDYIEEIPWINQKIKESESLQGTWYEDIGNTERKISYVRNGQFTTIKIQKIPTSKLLITKAQQIIFFSTSLSIGVVIAVICFLSSWMYQPVGEIFQNIQTIAGMKEEDEKNEITLALSGLTNIKQDMRSMKTWIRDNSIIQFLRHGREGDVVNQDMFGFGVCEFNLFTVLVLRYHMEKNESILLFLKENSRKTQGKQKIFCYEASQNESVILVCEYISNEKNIDKRDLAIGILEDLEQLYHICGCIGIAECNRVDILPHAYRKAVRLTGYHVLADQIRVIDEELLKEKKMTAVNEPEREEVLAFVRGEKELILSECVDRLLYNLSIYHIKAINKYLNELIIDVLRILDSTMGEDREQYEGYLENFLFNGTFINKIELREWLCQLFIQARFQMQAGCKSAATQIIENAVAYIEADYHNSGLSVETVAELCGVSVSYFSKLFNRYTGQSFPDYVCKVRLNNAHQLLSGYPNMAISEISKRVGFNSASYFSAEYRKYYGVSPSQMRRDIVKLKRDQNNEINYKNSI